MMSQEFHSRLKQFGFGFPFFFPFSEILTVCPTAFFTRWLMSALGNLSAKNPGGCNRGIASITAGSFSN
jgi:hypothetical protein